MSKAGELLDRSRSLLQESQEQRRHQLRLVRAKQQRNVVEATVAEALCKAEEALASFARVGDEAGVLKAQHQIVLAKISSGDAAGALSDAQRQLQSAHAAGNRTGMAVMLVAEAEALAAFGNYRGALESARQGASLARAQSDRSLEFHALCGVKRDCHLKLGEQEEALQSTLSAYAICRQIAERRTAARAYMSVACALQNTACLADAEACVREALIAYRALGNSKEEATAQSLLAQVLVSRKAFQEALRPAKEALDLALRIGDAGEVVTAAEALVQAYIGCNDAPAALEAAEKVLREFKTRQDIPGQAGMAALLATAFRAQDSSDNIVLARSAIEEGLRLSDELGDLQSRAEVLLEASELSLGTDDLDSTLGQAQEALMVFRDMGDWSKERRAKALLSEVYSRRGEPELAPNRPEALKLAHAMAEAITSRNATSFHDAAERFAALAVLTPPVSKKEHREIFGSILRKDEAASEFIQANMPSEVSGPVLSAIDSGVSFMQVEKREMYKGFRMSGIAYGPRFRGVDAAYGIRSAVQGYDDEAHAYAVYQLQDATDDWEKQFSGHPALLDSALQSGSVIGAVMQKSS